MLRQISANPEETIGITYHVLADGLKMGGMTGRPKSKTTPLNPPENQKDEPTAELARDVLAAYLEEHKLTGASTRAFESALRQQKLQPALKIPLHRARSLMDEARDRGLVVTVTGSRNSVLYTVPVIAAEDEKAA